MSKFFKESIDYISSVRFTIVILVTIALLSGLGTLVGQNRPIEEYVHAFGRWFSDIILRLSITDIYHSIYFNALLMLLITNIVLCTMKFAPKRLKGAFLRDHGISPVRRGGAYSQRGEMTSDLSLTSLTKRVKKIFRKPAQRLIVEKTDKQTIITSIPHPFFKLGALLVHISIILTLLGGLISFLFGFKGEMLIEEGTISNIIVSQDNKFYRLPFAVALDKFTISLYRDGTPKEYRSDIRFIEEANEVNASLFVNHPASFDKIRFYQSTFEFVNTDKITVEVIDGEGDTIYLGELYYREPLDLSESGISITYVEFHPDFNGSGPAAHLVIRSDETMDALWASSRPPDFENEVEKDYYFILRDYHMLFKSGISVVKQPGMPFIWTGFILMVIGFSFPLVSSRGSYTVEIEDSGRGGKNKVTIFGSPGRFKSGFEDEFNKYVEKMREVC